MKLFDFLNSINFDKKNLIRESENPDLAEKVYTPYIVNKGLSFFIDTIYLANEMNQRSHCEKLLQYDFLINSVRKKKRYSKWYKSQKSDDLEAIKEYYGYSYDKAHQVADLLTEEQITTIKKSLGKGGKNNDSRSE